MDLAAKAIMLGYALIAAWQIAKMLNPALQVQEDIAIARIRSKMATRRPGLEALPELPAGAARPIYDDTR